MGFGRVVMLDVDMVVKRVARRVSFAPVIVLDWMRRMSRMDRPLMTAVLHILADCLTGNLRNNGPESRIGATHIVKAPSRVLMCFES
jgi:hypothetical protein